MNIVANILSEDTKCKVAYTICVKLNKKARKCYI